MESSLRDYVSAITARFLPQGNPKPRYVNVDQIGKSYFAANTIDQLKKDDTLYAQQLYAYRKGLHDQLEQLYEDFALAERELNRARSFNYPEGNEEEMWYARPKEYLKKFALNLEDAGIKITHGEEKHDLRGDDYDDSEPRRVRRANDVEARHIASVLKSEKGFNLAKFLDNNLVVPNIKEDTVVFVPASKTFEVEEVF